MKHKGFFISIEKTKEGLGGTTQAQKLADNLRDTGYEVILTREPGGTELGRALREILLTKQEPHGELSKATELFLLMADRAQHYKEVLKPSLKNGVVVISDRFFDSTLVYQGGGRGWKSAFLWRLHHASAGSLLPDLTLVFDGEPHVQRSETDRFEAETDAFHERVARSMQHLVAKNQLSRYEVVNANQDQEVIAQQVLHIVQQRMLASNYKN